MHPAPPRPAPAAKAAALGEGAGRSATVAHVPRLLLRQLLLLPDLGDARRAAAQRRLQSDLLRAANAVVGVGGVSLASGGVQGSRGAERQSEVQHLPATPSGVSQSGQLPIINCQSSNKLTANDSMRSSSFFCRSLSSAVSSACLAEPSASSASTSSICRCGTCHCKACRCKQQWALRHQPALNGTGLTSGALALQLRRFRTVQGGCCCLLLRRCPALRCPATHLLDVRLRLALLLQLCAAQAQLQCGWGRPADECSWSGWMRRQDTCRCQRQPAVQAVTVSTRQRCLLSLACMPHPSAMPHWVRLGLRRREGGRATCCQTALPCPSSRAASPWTPPP